MAVPPAPGRMPPVPGAVGRDRPFADPGPGRTVPSPGRGIDATGDDGVGRGRTPALGSDGRDGFGRPFIPTVGR